MIKSKEQASFYMKTGTNTQDNSKVAKNMEKEPCTIKMVTNTTVNGCITIEEVMVFQNLLDRTSMKVSGLTT